MEHTRKIMLGDGFGRELPTEKLIPEKKVSFKLPKETASTLDNEIKRILKLKTDDRTKWTLYQETLHQFLAKPKKDVLEHVKYKERAVKLLDSLNGHVTWTDDGTASVRGKELPHSHIAELVEAYFDTARPRPIGWDKFTTVLPGAKTEVQVDKGVQWEKWPSRKRSSRIAKQRKKK